MNLAETAGKMTIGKTAVLRAVWVGVTLYAVTLLIISTQKTIDAGLFANSASLLATVDAAIISLVGAEFLSSPFILWAALLQLTSFTGMGVFLFWRRHNDRNAILTSLLLITVGIGFWPSTIVLPFLQPQWHWPISILQIISFSSLVFFIALFPNGRFLSRWMRILLLIWLGVAASWLFTPALNPYRSSSFLGLFVFASWCFLGLLSQIFRFRKMQHIEKQQIKWVLGGLGTTFFCFVTLILLSALGDSLGLPTIPNLIVALLGISSILLPLAIGIATLSYRLYNVDMVLNRTLVYGSLTALITAVYALITGGLALAIGQQGRLAGVMMATAVIILLLRPIQKRLQLFANRVVPAPQSANPLLANLHRSPPQTIDPPQRLLAWSVWAVAILSAIGGIVMIPFTHHLRSYVTLTPPSMRWVGLPLDMLSDGVFIIFATVGLLLRLRQPNNRMGMWGLLIGLAGGVNTLAGNYTLLAYMVLPEKTWVLAPAAAWITQWISPVATVIGIVVIPLLFPNGRLPSSRWKPFFRLVMVAILSRIVLLAFADMNITSYAEGYGIPNPLGVWALTPVAQAGVMTAIVLLAASREFRTRHWRLAGILTAVLIALMWLTALTHAGDVTLAFTLLAVVVSLVWRLHHATGAEKQQIKWMVWSLSLIAVFGAGFFLSGGLTTLLGTIFFFVYTFSWVMTAVSLGVALLHYRLYDIDLIINRTLVYGGMTVVIVTVYTVIVGGLSAVFQMQENFLIALLATGLMAVLFQPVRERLQRTANRLMFGERDDPYAVLSKLGTQLQTTATPEAMLQSVVETIASTLKLPYVAIELADEQGRLDGAATGKAVAKTSEHPLRYQNETVGYLVVSPRSPGESLTERERQLLADMAGQTGAMAYAVRLTAALQRSAAALQQSREKLVLAREEERRRIRRDLHDGLGPTLASQTFALDAALDLLETDPPAAAKLLQSLKAQNQETVADIRRLVYELRPPALDELGVIGALQAHVAQVDGRSAPYISIIAIPDPLPPLSAAVEVATYRIVLEAITNVVRHAHARRCEVCLCVERNGRSHLRIDVSDDGVGLPPERHPGVGLSSMRERAEELGGRCEVAAGEKGGTQVTAVLPM